MGYILLILLTPNFLLGYNIAHITSSIALFLKKPKLTFRINWFTLIYLCYILYLFIRILIYILFNVDQIIINDLTEVKRIVILSIAFLLARPINIEKTRILTVMFVMLILLYVMRIDFYNGSHRFSSFLPSVNYIWAGVLFLILKGENLISRYDTIILSIIALLLSASLTSIFVSTVLLLIGLTIYKEFSIVKLGAGFALVIILGFTIVKSGVFNEFLFQTNKITSAYTLLLAGDITEYSSFQARLVVWETAKDFILEKPLFGHGVSKTILRYTDNQYLLTLFRYGIVGLILELTVLISLFIKSFSTKNYLVLLFVIGILLSGFTANSIYEIKLIPILGIFLGELFKFNNLNYRLS